MKKTVVSLAAVTTISGGLAAQAHAHTDEYVVNKGDTLWGISQKYNVTVNELKDWNDLNSNLIFPNDKLAVSKDNSTPAVSSADFYTVKSGDTLWSISQNYGITVNQLQKANNLSSTLIYPGDELSLKVAENGSMKKEAKETTKETKTETNKETTATESDVEQTASDDTSEAREITVTATAYTADCTGCSGVTATGIDLNANPDKKVIAVDPDVIPLGTEVYVEGYGYAVAGDVGGAIQGNKIDVFIPNREDALDWGVQTVDVKILD
ncbi:LysM peptidoglycan-binding domain-containing protein [Thalassobacillus pellis]|uniref:LysM peptidoglycan-binding domain-containing protein n=1 Tax=Thalassobacillus pellis TaxID=748008 RepID=UPI0019616994|nr:3D (Asp-Asp-Asp) domain-containing protein/LysM repeat protein [Thalassobacillus pellis]